MPPAKPFYFNGESWSQIGNSSIYFNHKAKKFSKMRLYWLQFRVLIYHKHVNTLEEPNY